METVETFLEHHGVKGQKWGVRHDPGHEGERVKVKKLGKLDQAWFDKIDKPKGWDAVAVHNRVADKVNANISAFNKKPQYKNANLIKAPNSPATKQYIRDFENLQARYFKEAVKEIHGVSPSGSMRTEVVKTPNGYVIKVHGAHTWTDVSHAENPSGDLTFQLILDDNGYISSIKNVENNIKQSLNLGIDFLEHHGIKGQKWGIRNKKSSSAVTPGRHGLIKRKRKAVASTKGFSKDAKQAHIIRKKAKTSPVKVKALSNTEINTFLNRVNLESRFSQATPTAGQKALKTVKDILGLGKTVNEVQTFSNSPTGKQIREGIKKKKNNK